MAHVIISAGHSPVDKGAVIGDLVEYDLTQKITDALESLLKDYPKLEYKRIPTGLSLPQKIQWINASGRFSENNDIAVEVHINDKNGEGTEDGVECWYAERGENASRKLCTLLMNNLCDETGMRRRSVNSEYDHPFRRLGYVHNTRTISALIEVGFMDHPKDKKILTSDDGIKKIAKGLLKGILAYYDLKEGEKDKEPKQKPDLPVHTDPGVNNMFPNGVPPQLSQDLANYANLFNGAMPPGNNSGFTMPSPTPVVGNVNNVTAMTPDERKSMVNRLFQRVLGRNADPKSLNYYSTSQMSEEALTKLMIDSTEHKNLIKAAKQFVSTKALLNNANREILELKSKLKDKDVEIESLRKFYKIKESTSVSEKIDSSEKERKNLPDDIRKNANNVIEAETKSNYVQDERFSHIEKKKNKREKKVHPVENKSSLKTQTLKTVRRPAGPFKAVQKLLRALGKLLLKE